MNPMRTKFRCVAVTRYADVCGGSIEFVPVYSTDPEAENNKFWKATPSGKIELNIVNANTVECFQPGNEYYVDFTPV